MVIEHWYLGRGLALRTAVGVALLGTIGFRGSPVCAGVINAGPTYSSITDTGYPYAALSLMPGSTAGNAVAVGYGSKYDAGQFLGYRAFRWDASGAVELGHLGTNTAGVTSTRAIAINAGGAIAGIAEKYDAGISKGNRAVRWDASGTAATELGHLGTDGSDFTFSEASAINADGAAVGYARKYDAGVYKGDRAVRWEASSTAAVELGHLGSDNQGSTFSQAFAINAAGTAVGVVEKFDGGVSKGNRAARWNAGVDTVTELGHLGTKLDGVTSAQSYAINDAGTAVGFAEKHDAGISMGNRAVRWDAFGAIAIELGHLGTTADGKTNNEAYAINAAGVAVGYANKYDAGVYKGDRAVRWDSSGTTATELGHLGTDSNGEAYNYAYSINAAGIAVGIVEEYDASGDFVATRAAAWGVDGAAIDLNVLLDPGDGWINLYQAVAISDAGWITGYGIYDPDGAGGQEAYTRLFLLDASSLVPEPASLSLALFVSTIAWRRRRKGSSCS